MEPANQPTLTEGTQAGQPVASKWSGLFRYHAAIAAVILLVAMILRPQQADKGCVSELNDGQWLEEGEWQPHDCTVHHFHTSEVEACIAMFSHVVVIGAEKWETVANLLCPATTNQDNHKDSTSERQVDKSHSCTARYVSQPNTCAVEDAVIQEYTSLAESAEQKGPVLVIHQPLYHTSSPLSDDSEYTCRDAVLAQFKAQLKLLTARPGSLIVQLDPNPAWRPSAGVDATDVYKTIYSSASRNTNRLLYLTSAFETGFAQTTIVQNEETSSTVPPELSLVLNTFCISALPPPSSSPSSPSPCCVHSSHSHYFAITVLIIILAAYLGVGLIILSGATFALIPHLEAVNFDLDRFISLLHSIGGGTLVMLYILMADGLEYFPSVERSYSPMLFLLCGLVFVAVAILTCNKTVDVPQLLSSDRCNAWRGGLLLLYIALQYCSVDQVVAGRLCCELLIGGLVFISGYTHFTHYWLHADFTWRRLGIVLFRLNLLPVLLCLTLGTSYGAYSLPVLLTLGFLFTSAFMASWPQMTPASLQGMSVQGPQHVVVVVKFGFAFLLISFLPWIEDVIQGVTSLPVLGSILQPHTSADDDSSLYRWMYTHRYMTLGGMVFGYVMCNIHSNSPATVEGFRRLKVVTAGFSVAVMLGYGLFLVSAKDFAVTSESQSLIAVPVLLAYALILYFSEPLQRYESSMLAELGSSSMWLFISYQHILLSRNASAILLLIPGPPLLVNSVLVLCVFLFCQRLMHFAQHTLTHFTLYTSTDPPPNAPLRTPSVTV